MNFEEWLTTVRNYMVERGYASNLPEAEEYGEVAEWKGYFEGGYRPDEAVEEEFSYV